jgi:hypothetical protein
VRTNAVCPGYRDEIGLVFRDESETVVRKATMNSNQKHGTSETREAPTTVPALPLNSLTSLRTALRQHPRHGRDGRLFACTTYEDLAIAFFFTHYLTVNSPSDKAHLDFLPSMCSALLMDSPLPSAIVSVGMAGLANKKKAPEIMIAARRKYTSALSLTMAALSKTASATTDQTLITVILLGLYEVMCFVLEVFFLLG